MKKLIKKPGAIKIKQPKKDRLLSMSIVILSIALILLSIYLLFKIENVTKTLDNNVNTSGSSPQNGEGELVYVDEKYGYSISYPRLLEPRTITQNNYLEFIIFFVPNNLKGDGFAISVSENGLDEEKNKITKEISTETELVSTKEEKIEKDGFPGIKITFEPKDKEVFRSKSVVIFNNGKYSYSLSSSPDFIDEAIRGFNISK